MTHVTLATTKAREAFAPIAVESLLNQTLKSDTFHIELNGYIEPPKWVEQYPITYTCHKFNLGSEARFRRVTEVHGIYATCDDDIIYPTDYLSYLHDALMIYQGCIVGFHGTIFKPLPIRSYRADMVRRFDFWRGCDTDTDVHQLGAGVMAFDTETVPLTYADFTHRNMADPQIAAWGAKHGIRLICLTRDAGWLNMIEGSQDTGAEIWRAVDTSDYEQTEIINSVRTFAPNGGHRL